MKTILFLLGIACYVWAGYSVIRFLFTINEYTGFAWILSIIIEIFLGNLLIEESNKLN
mgnify:CR=1 FL=1